ncbi:PREDICTED: protein grainyhead-like [Rhagoletis zephyria]|uniref:protein grainyhead-like n=1 Tax=Rhagoletis zephyria TaxID=28612 RepID=UPI00081186BC|nr:PREDICTED: protein grainyhead-like [Rhagoletis zephyria]
MREVNGQLRGLLKKPNRPPPARKNRVVFDETRNEFFEADYIILIREDCAYDEEDEEPCTCGEHELVRLCCEEGCQCNYSATVAAGVGGGGGGVGGPGDETRTPQSPKYAPPIEFVDEAALSPPDGYKDNGLKNTLGGALSGHIFGAQHIQQLQVIQRLQQQRAAMLAARNNNQIPPPPPPVGSAALSQHHQQQHQQQQQQQQAGQQAQQQQHQQLQQQHSPDDDSLGVCTECAECAECAAKQLQDTGKNYADIVSF